MTYIIYAIKMYNVASQSVFNANLEHQKKNYEIIDKFQYETLSCGLY